MGHALCQKLIGKNVSVRVLLRDSSKAKTLPSKLSTDLVVGDLTDFESLQAACTDVDVVLHLAGIAHVASGGDPRLAETNSAGTGNLLKAAIQNQVNRLVFISSTLAQVHEQRETGKATSEDVTEYGASKWAAEQQLRQAQRDGLIDTVVLRPVNVYGPGMKGNIAGMISLINRGRLPPLPALKSRISLVAVDDLAQAILLAMEAPSAVGKTYTVTDGVEYSINQLEKAIYQELGKRLPRWRTPAMVLYAASVAAGLLSAIRRNRGAISSRTFRNLTSDNLFSNAQIVRELAFNPTRTLYQALPEIVEKIREK